MWLLATCRHEKEKSFLKGILITDALRDNTIFFCLFFSPWPLKYNSVVWIIKKKKHATNIKQAATRMKNNKRSRAGAQGDWMENSAMTWMFLTFKMSKQTRPVKRAKANNQCVMLMTKGLFFQFVRNGDDNPKQTLCQGYLSVVMEYKGAEWDRSWKVMEIMFLFKVYIFSN